MTESSAAGRDASRNPAPRPALRRVGGEVSVARPGTTPPDAEADSPEASPPAVPDPAAKAGKQGKPGKPGKADRAGKAGKAGKGKGKGRTKQARTEDWRTDDKRSKKAHGDAGEPGALSVTLPKPVRKALARAAADRDTTPEALAALVLVEWVDH